MEFQNKLIVQQVAGTMALSGIAQHFENKHMWILDFRSSEVTLSLNSPQICVADEAKL